MDILKLVRDMKHVASQRLAYVEYPVGSRFLISPQTFTDIEAELVRLKQLVGKPVQPEDQ